MLGWKKKRFVKWMLVGLLSVSAIVPLRLAIALHQAPQPQAIFILGGDFARTHYAAQVWQTDRKMDIWVSDFSENLSQQCMILTQSGVPVNQIRLDGQATDTVTNFTTLVDQFVQYRVQHLYLVTSDYHMRRASAIAAIVLGIKGIAVSPLPVSSTIEPEPLTKVLRDYGRAVLWLITGRTGSSLNPRLRREEYL